MRRAWLLLAMATMALALLWACGGDDSTPAAVTDAGGDADAGSLDDTSTPLDVILPDTSPLPEIDGGPMCDPAKPFGAPVPVSELDTTGTESSIRLSHDLLTAYFASARDGGQGSVDLWSATRAQPADSFSNLKNLAAIDSPSVDTHASVTADGLTMLFESSRGLPSQSILFASRNSTQDDFIFPKGLPGIASFGVEADPFVRADGQVLYFTAGANTGDLDIYRAYRSGDDFVGATSVGELNGQAQESLPTVSPNDRLIYFASNRVDGSPKGGFDIWFAVRPSINDPYSAPALAPELNTANDDFPDFISPDGCTLWMHRSVAGDAGQVKAIYVATKSM